MAEKERWIVTLADAGAAARVEEELRAAGFRIADLLTEIGVITGTCDSKTARKIARIAGVADVSPDQPIDIGPPGSPDTW